MLQLVARVLAIVVGLLAVVGFFIEGELLLGFMNVDLPLDIARLVLAIALFYVGFAHVPASAIRAVLIVTAVLYILIGILAFVDHTLFGMLPTGLTGFDIGFHLVVGIGAAVVAFLPAHAGTTTTTARS